MRCYSEYTCANCGKKDVKSRCSQCKFACYCSKECQVSHWKKVHKSECKPCIKLCSICTKSPDLCKCKNNPHHDDDGLMYEAPNTTMEERIENLKKFGDVVEKKSKGEIFGKNISRDLIDKGFPRILEKNRIRLHTMMETYWTKDSLTLGGKEIPRHMFAAVCQSAYSKFIDFDWVEMTLMESVMINNAFQASDPKIYPLNDPELKEIFGALTICHESIKGCAFDNVSLDVTLTML
ncbi:ubiquitin carboxyl-terminal hydrolase [Acrasis kona]|uniref:Ubiquitin carboxyl-terminal hydrolase n=1 Tax=Acrasis kona TaxID=1008807 RepID=A0AAW2ZHQ9_9EUKA